MEIKQAGKIENDYGEGGYLKSSIPKKKIYDLRTKQPGGINHAKDLGRELSREIKEPVQKS